MECVVWDVRVSWLLCACSDDRSPETFRQRIASSTQMQAVLNADSRPNCLVIDEIDGAPAVSANVFAAVT